MPYSSETAIRLLKDHGITDTSHLEEIILDMGSKQILTLLELALSIDFPFTYLVFSITLYRKRIPDDRRDLMKHILDRCDLMKVDVSVTSKMVLDASLQKSTGKFLFAEAKDDFVDFLFGFLSIPLGTVVGTLLNGAASFSCMYNIFKSISSMSVGRCLKSQDIKDMLLKPHLGQQHSSKNQLFPLKGTGNFSRPINGKVYKYKDPRINESYLKQSGLFIVTDDLIVTPSTSLSTIDMLKKLRVPLDDVEICEVNIGLKEGLSMLEASLRAYATLTTSFQHQLKN